MSSGNDTSNCSDSAALVDLVGNDRTSWVSSQSVNIPAAVVMLEEAVAQHPEDQRLAYSLALLFCQSERQKEGERLLNCLRSDPAKSEWTKRAHLLTAVLRAKEERWSDVVETLGQTDAALSSDSTDLEIRKRRLLALAMLHSNRLNELLELIPDDFEIFCLQARGLIRAERYDQALAAINTAGGLAQDSDPAHHTLARLLCNVTSRYVSEGRWETAARGLRECLSLNAGLRRFVLSQGKLAEVLALISLLGGDRTTATNLWEQQQLQHPSHSTPGVTHALLVSSLSEALHHEEAGRPELAATAWLRVLRNGVLLLHDLCFWQDFIGRRAQAYKLGTNLQSASDMGEFLVQMLRKWLPPNSSLGLALNWEIASAGALRRMGGLPVGELPGETCVYGVHMLRQLSVTTGFGHFISELRGKLSRGPETIRFHKSHLKNSDGGSALLTLPTVEEFSRQTRYFSRFGAAQVLLDQEFPEQALALLDQVACDRCISHQTDQTCLDGWWPRVCHEECDDFRAGNPGYLELENAGYRLWRDATELVLEAHLQAAGAALAITPLGVTKIVEHWREAVRLSAAVAKQDKVEEGIATHVLALAQVLFEQRNLDDAIDLLEGACSVCRPDVCGELEGSLSEILNSRGVARAQQTEPDWKGALRDFSRSVELNRFVPLRLLNLIHALRARAVEVHRSDSRAAAHFLLRARNELVDGFRRFTQESEFPVLMEQLKVDQEFIGRNLKRESILKAARGDHQGELDDLRLACELASSETDQASLRIKLVQKAPSPLPASEPGTSEPRIRLLDTGVPEWTPTSEPSIASRIKVLDSGGAETTGE